MNGAWCELLKELRTEVGNHVVDEITVDHAVNVNDVGKDVIKHVGVKVKDEDMRKLDVGNLLKDDDRIAVDAIGLQVVGEVVNVELSVDDVNEDVDVRVNDEITRIMTLDPDVVVTLDVHRTAEDDNLDDVVRADVVSETEADDSFSDVIDDDLLPDLVQVAAYGQS